MGISTGKDYGFYSATISGRSTSRQKKRGIATNGYIVVFVGKHHHLALKNGTAYEHRLVMEEKLGRRLLPNEQIHHIDSDRQNNNPDNLEVYIDYAHHAATHRRTLGKRLPDETNPIIECKCGCGARFQKYDRHNRPREFVSGHNMEAEWESRRR